MPSINNLAHATITIYTCGWHSVLQQPQDRHTAKQHFRRYSQNAGLQTGQTPGSVLLLRQNEPTYVCAERLKKKQQHTNCRGLPTCNLISCLFFFCFGCYFIFFFYFCFDFSLLCLFVKLKVKNASCEQCALFHIFHGFALT